MSAMERIFRPLSHEVKSLDETSDLVVEGPVHQVRHVRMIAMALRVALPAAQVDGRDALSAEAAMQKLPAYFQHCLRIGVPVRAVLPPCSGRSGLSTNT
jgi:hypothetical protein